MSHEIVVNGRFLSRRVTGVERHGRSILQYIGNRVRIEKTRWNGLPGHAWEQFILPTRLKSESILWSPANTGPLSVSKQALTVHDLSPLEHPEWFKKAFAIRYQSLLPTLIMRAKIIFTPSEYMKQKISKRFGAENVVVTPNGVYTSVFRPEAQPKIKNLPQKYILFVGSIQPRKNLDGLLKAWHNLKNDFPEVWLVIAGDKGKVFRKTRIAGGERVHYLNYVSEIDLPGLYAGAKLFVMPSFDEGFGLPALEAMACGTPTLVSNGGALPEVVGDAGLIFDVLKPDMLLTSMRQCLQDDDLRFSLKEKGLARAKEFSWPKTAEIIWKALNEI